MTKIKINNLILTQEYIRSLTRILDIKYFLANGNTLDSNPIKLIEVPEEGIYLHDGLTRVLGCYASGRDYLNTNEYIYKVLSISDYLDFAPQNGWYTPLDPRSSVRSFRFMFYKKLIEKEYEQNLDQNIWKKYHKQYTQNRQIKYVYELL